MNLAVLFLSAFLVSYLGAIPPGAINLSVLQYTLQGRKRAAFSFALATAFIEYVYVILALKFALYFNENESIAQHFKLLSSSVLLLLGLLSLLKKPKHIIQPSAAAFRHAFQKGALVGLANPLIIPFWLRHHGVSARHGMDSAHRPEHVAICRRRCHGWSSLSMASHPPIRQAFSLSGLSSSGLSFARLGVDRAQPMGLYQLISEAVGGKSVISESVIS